MTNRLQTFWFEFEGDAFTLPPGVSIGCGVTAFDYADALRILNTRVFNNKKRPPFKKVIEGVKVSDLDINHVIPNMKSLIYYGVWFPFGYEM